MKAIINYLRKRKELKEEKRQQSIRLQLVKSNVLDLHRASDLELMYNFVMTGNITVAQLPPSHKSPQILESEKAPCWRTYNPSQY